jgi:hypothetical protein
MGGELMAQRLLVWHPIDPDTKIIELPDDASVSFQDGFCFVRTDFKFGSERTLRVYPAARILFYEREDEPTNVLG